VAALGLSETMSPLLRASTPNRSVVCIYLIGGNDSNNMIVPLDSPAYDAYAAARGPLAISRDALLPVTSGSSARYGLHPNLAGLRDLYNQNALAVLANVGRTFAAGVVQKDLYEHTGAMQVRFLHDGYMGIPWATPSPTDTGSARVLGLNHGVTMASPDADSTRHKGLTAAVAAATPGGALTPTSSLNARLSVVLAALKLSPLRQQAFLVPMEGFDTHVMELERQSQLFQQLNDGMVAFYNTLRDMGLANSVTIYTDTEFNRTLTPNTSGGTEPAWGGHQLILGGATLGGRIYGSFPSLQVGGADDAAGNGTWIPSTSNAQYAAAVAAWYGKSDLSDVPEYAGLINPSQPRLNFLTA
jgi:uncharacterized protein (DUF1501 family)